MCLFSNAQLNDTLIDFHGASSRDEHYLATNCKLCQRNQVFQEAQARLAQSFSGLKPLIRTIPG
jgi:hypothetical protein